MYCPELAGNAGPKKSPSRHHRTTLSGYIFATKARIDNQKKKLVKQQRLILHMSSQYGELRPPSGWDLLASLRHPSKFQWVSRLGSVTARHSSGGRQANIAALNRGRHLYSAGRPSCWALAHISSLWSSAQVLGVYWHWRAGIKEQCHFGTWSGVQWWMKKGWDFPGWGQCLEFPHCFNNVGWITRRASSP